MMLLKLGCRLLKEVDPRLLGLLFRNFGIPGMRAMRAFERRKREGRLFPAFVFLSLTNECNLRCQGCWVRPTSPGRSMDPALADEIIASCKREGSRFFGLLGGEPLMFPGLQDLLERHRDCYFQIFTNGTLLTDEIVAAWRRLGHVTPLISLEGSSEVSDDRRGGARVFDRTLAGIELCRRHRLFFGVATSVCRSNVQDLVSEAHLQDLIGRGVHYVWYYVYRPVGPDPRPDLALAPEDILRLRRFMVDMRCKLPILIVDASWDHQGRALCPAAMGISHHIGPAGGLEPCPPIQFAREKMDPGKDLARLFKESTFLPAFQRLAAQTTRGCILMERPDLLRNLILREGAEDTSGRNSLYELDSLKPVPGVHAPGQEIPEKCWVYRWAKKHWFFGFGAYG